MVPCTGRYGTRTVQYEYQVFRWRRGGRCGTVQYSTRTRTAFQEAVRVLYEYEYK